MCEIKLTINASLRRGILVWVALALALVLPAQDLPLQMSLDPEAGRLRLGGVQSDGFYEESVVRDLYLDFQDPDFWQFMHDNFGTENYAMATLRYEGTSYDSVGVAFKGQTSYSGTLKRNSEKFSFSIKLDEYIEGQDIDGYNNLNFNNAFGDYSFMKEVLYAHLSREFVPALKGNFIHLWLNGEDWGLYPSIQQLNGDFIREWFPDKDGIRWRADAPADQEEALPPPLPAVQTVDEGGGGQWGDGTAALNYHGEDTLKYQQYYTLKDTDMDDPWSRMVRVCRVLNETPLEQLVDSLASYMDLDGVLWFLAQEILFSDDDSYVHKGKMDYYLFLEEASGKMIPLEFDGNSAMTLRNSGWSPFLNEEDPNYPLLNRLLAIPELRQRYIAHVRTILDRYFDPLVYNPVIDDYDILIRDLVLNDPISTVNNYQFNRGVRDLRSFMSYRKDSILLWPEFNRVIPSINQVESRVDGSQGAEIMALASHPEGIAEVRLYYGTGLTGSFDTQVMEDTGNGNFSGSIPAYPAGTFVRYYLEAIATDSARTASYMPEGAEYDIYFYQVASVESGVDALVINELMASNDITMADEAGEYDDWVEIHNFSNLEIELEGFHLSDDASEIRKWIFPDTSINAGQYMVIWTDDDEEQGPLHASFKLSASGEEVILSDTLGNIIDHVIFGEQETDVSLGRWPDATGYFQAMVPTFRETNIIASTDGPQAADEFRVYPNPCRDILHIATDAAPDGDIRIYSLLGQQVMHLSFASEINVSELPEGIYLLRMDSRSVLFRKLK